MKKVPFYANHDDNLRCMLAVYRMVVMHFTGRELHWDQLIQLSGFQPGKAAWSVLALTNLARDFDLDVRVIEPFDYRRFASQGKDYLYDLYDNQEVEWQLTHTNVLEIHPLIGNFLATIRPECRRASLQDIDAMLTEGRLVSVMLNANTLNGHQGYTAHSILVIDKDGSDYIVHDPGPPAMQSRRISAEELWQAMGGEQNTVEVTGFKIRVSGRRLDQYVIRQKPDLSRAYATRLINEGKVTVNGKPSKPGYKLRDGDDVHIGYNEADEPEVPDIDLPVLYEDDDCIVINKPAGVLTHNKGVRHVEATVASFVRSRLKPQLYGERAGIVHRLDRATSGVIICAKTSAALSHLQKQFHDRLAQKTYSAVVQGQLQPPKALIDMPIERNPKAPATFRVGANGKPAQTLYEVLEEGAEYSLLELQPKTGRTHQLRVHLQHQHHPIVGDTLYGGQEAERLYLHAHKLTISLPNGETGNFEAPIPAEFKTLVNSQKASE